MNLMKLTLALGVTVVTAPLFAADYKIDPAHSFIVFRIPHLSFSWTYGQFNRVSGEFAHDPTNPGANKISVKIDPASVDTNHAERDAVARERFLKVADFPEATFESTQYRGSETEGVLQGVLTLHGVSKPISIDIVKVGEGKDPWGGYRAGFSGKVALDRTDWGMVERGPGESMEFEITIEGIRQ